MRRGLVRPESYHQGRLLLAALAERGVPAQRIAMDHMNGSARVAGMTLGIVYPDSWFERTRPLLSAAKTVSYLFIGNITSGRRRMLNTFAEAHPGTEIVSTLTGRDKAVKGRWDESYYRQMGRARFGLCPHHPDWQGPWETMWTYRFVECCMVGAAPVLFRRTPLAPAFVEGFRFVWDDEAHTYDPADALHNRALAEERFRLP
jgi:hypothetical protein